jgi:hypothetical protein
MSFRFNPFYFVKGKNKGNRKLHREIKTGGNEVACQPRFLLFFRLGIRMTQPVLFQEALLHAKNKGSADRLEKGVSKRVMEYHDAGKP